MTGTAWSAGLRPAPPASGGRTRTCCTHGWRGVVFRRDFARAQYVVAALRAACRSETGAPSQRAIRSRGVPAPASIFMPNGVCGRTREWAFLPVGASDRHRPPPAGERGLAARTDGATPSASAIRPRGSTSLRPSGPRAGQRPALQAIPVIRQDCIYTATGVEVGGPGRFGAGEGASGEQVRIESPPEHFR